MATGSLYGDSFIRRRSSKMSLTGLVTFGLLAKVVSEELGGLHKAGEAV